jgi:predicted PurR-regulated permease PerM
MPLTPTQKRAFSWLALLLTLVAVLWLLAPVLTPFVVAAILAYALTPVVDWLDGLGRGRIPRLLAVVLVELVFLLALLAVLLLIVPILLKQFPLLREQLPALLDHFSSSLQPLLAQFGLHVTMDVLSIKAFLMEHLSANVQDSVGQVLASVKMGGSVAFSVLGNAVLIPVVLFYLLMEWHRFMAMLMILIPPRLRPAVQSFTDEADDVLGQYLRGQLLVMLVLAVYYSAGLGLFGLDLALPIGVFTGLLVAIPYVGFGLGLILATLAGFLEFSAQAGHVSALLMVAVVYGLGQVLESFVLTPRLVGERIGLHPLAVIFALLTFGHLLGFVGILIALPVSAVLLVAIRRLRSTYLGSALYQDS